MHHRKIRNADWSVIEEDLSVQIKPSDSHFWKGILRVWEDFLGLWEDTWVGSIPLKMQFSGLYSIVNYPHASVANVMNHRPLNISFLRALVGDKQTAWNNLVAKVCNIQLSNERDIFTWDLQT
ncbi:hypothetical protein U9M48_040149, partial [Paspalum notatum var. saurae]